MKRLGIGALALLAGLGLCSNVFAQSGDFPRYRGGGTFEDYSYSNKPRRGYSGWAGPPLRGLYCDYRRNPVRECNGTRCRVVRWELQQYCY